MRRIVRAAPRLGIETLTLYAFSSENWRRPAEEVSDLMSLLRHHLLAELEELDANGARLSLIGDWRSLKPDVVLCDLHLPRISGLEVTERIVERSRPARSAAAARQHGVSRAPRGVRDAMPRSGCRIRVHPRERGAIVRSGCVETRTGPAT